METLSEKIRNKLSPVKNVIALIQRYKNETSGEGKRKVLEFIMQSEDDLKRSLDEISKLL